MIENSVGVVVVLYYRCCQALDEINEWMEKDRCVEQKEREQASVLANS